jgi:hypothetical protein
VGGVGDKGKANAIKIDERTIRTAQEAFCGQNGRYGTGPELVAGGFLSELPTYHSVGAQTTGGACNGWAFSILPTSLADPDSGKWTLANTSPLAKGGLKRLRDGKVVHFACDNPPACSGGTLTAICDSTPAGPIAQTERKYSFSVLLTENCGSNCDKILVNMQEGWHLFNPAAAAGTQWENLGHGQNSYSDGAFNIGRLFQFRDLPSTPVNECGDNCGKVLINGGSERVDVELYDPKVSGPAAFTLLSYGGLPEIATSVFDQMLLPDGRALLYGADFSDSPTAFLLSPATLVFSSAAAPIFKHGASPGPPSVLPSGEILFANGSNNATRLDWEIYSPQPGGTGSWRQPASPSGCFTPPASERRCQPMGELPDGRVLAASGTSTNPDSESGLDQTAWLFDPMTEKWAQTTDKPTARLLFAVLLDPRTGPCGSFCNRILAHRGTPGFFPLLTALYSP